MSNEALDQFGKLLIREVRDRTIAEWDRILSGEMKGRTADKVRQEFSGMSPTAIESFKTSIPRIVDTTLHNAMVALEQDEYVELSVETASTRCESIRDESDGLSGELYGSNGWVSRFSEERHEETY